MQETQETPKKSAGSRAVRSPPYPFISLAKAIERVKPVYEEAKHHDASIELLAKAWGYSTSSSGLLQTAAALLQFGLLQDEGSGGKRRFRLTNDALRIVQDPNPLSEKRKEAIVRSALFPKIHQELWNKFGASGGETLLQTYLTIDRREAGEAPFSEKAASDLISEYKETIAYAELEKNAGQTPKKEDIKEGENSDDGNGHINNDPPPPPPPPAGAKVMQGEREIFKEEEAPQQHLRLIVAGDLSAYLLDTLDDFVERQRKRLGLDDAKDDKKPN